MNAPANLWRDDTGLRRRGRREAGVAVLTPFSTLQANEVVRGRRGGRTSVPE